MKQPVDIMLNFSSDEEWGTSGSYRNNESMDQRKEVNILKYLKEQRQFSISISLLIFKTELYYNSV